MSKKKVVRSTKPTPIVAEGKQVPKQWEGMQRKPDGRLVRKGVGITPAGMSSLIKQRMGAMAFKVLRQEMTPDRFRSIIQKIITVVEEYPDHKDWGRMAEFLVRLATDPDKANDNSQTNVQITINAVRENAVAAQVFLGINPINVKIVKSTATHAGGHLSDATPVVPAGLPSPVASGQEQVPPGGEVTADRGDVGSRA